VSTLADQVGACTAILQPLHALIEAHVLAAERLHGDDTTVPILAKGKTVTGHIWTYVRDDRPFDGRAPPVSWSSQRPDQRDSGMNGTPKKTFRCAIYTRKSTEHNLDLEFNSLDAQRPLLDLGLVEGGEALHDDYPPTPPSRGLGGRIHFNQ
jgi:hypothetical protein